MNAFTFDITAYADLTKAMKSADTTAENKATPWGRATLTGLLVADDGGKVPLTIATMTAALCAAYKPKTASGKAANTIGALPASPRGRANTMKYIFDNIDVDGVRPVVEAFIGETKDAPKTIAALHTAIKAAIKAAGDKLAGEADSGETESEAEQQPQQQPISLGVYLRQMADGIRTMSVDDIAAFQTEIDEVMAACSEAAARLSDSMADHVQKLAA